MNEAERRELRERVDLARRHQLERDREPQTLAPELERLRARLRRLEAAHDLALDKLSVAEQEREELAERLVLVSEAVAMPSNRRKYSTEAERVEARRRSWRMSKMRRRMQASPPPGGGPLVN